jgi:VanZ family protein
MHVWKKRIKNWLPVCVWAGLIFYFSTDHFSSDQTGALFGFFFSWIPAEALALLHGAVRKLGHWTAYFVLAVLTMRALRLETGKTWALRHAGLTLLFIFFYALSDEWHQSFVASRTASLADVLIDLVGGICGILWTYRYVRGTFAPLRSRMSEN